MHSVIRHRRRRLLGLVLVSTMVLVADPSAARMPDPGSTRLGRVVRKARAALAKRTQRTLTVYAFRQTDDMRAKDRFLYANTGHVGFSFNRGKTVLGFNPQLGNVDRSRWSGLIEAFKNGAVTRGIVTDDTAVMARARSLGIPVKETRIKVGALRYLRVRFNVLVDRLLGKHTWKRYAFPPPFGPVGSRRRTFNCAAYLRSVGLGDTSPFGPGGRLLDAMGGPELPVHVPPALASTASP